MLTSLSPAISTSMSFRIHAITADLITGEWRFGWVGWVDRSVVSGKDTLTVDTATWLAAVMLYGTQH